MYLFFFSSVSNMPPMVFRVFQAFSKQFERSMVHENEYLAIQIDTTLQGPHGLSIGGIFQLNFRADSYHSHFPPAMEVI